MAERQMAAFIPEALSLRYGVSDITPKEVDYPFLCCENRTQK